jgi:hypothetical protein
MKYSNIYVFFGLVVLTYFVFGLHKKSKNTNFKISSLLRQEKYTNKENQLRCSIETPATRRMTDIKRESPYGGIGQVVTGQPPSQFYNFDPHNREPEETKIFNSGSTKCFSCENQAPQMDSKFRFSNPTKCFDCEKQVKTCNNRSY